MQEKDDEVVLVKQKGPDLESCRQHKLYTNAKDYIIYAPIAMNF